MSHRSLPRELEQTVLLALAGAEGEAQGGEIYDRIVTITGRDLSLAAVYITLARLEEKGWATVRAAAPAPGRGGKPRKFYQLSADGGCVLAEVHARFEALWGGASRHPLVAPSSEVES